MCDHWSVRRSDVRDHGTVHWIRAITVHQWRVYLPLGHDHLGQPVSSKRSNWPIVYVGDAVPGQLGLYERHLYLPSRTNECERRLYHYVGRCSDMQGRRPDSTDVERSRRKLPENNVCQWLCLRMELLLQRWPVHLLHFGQPLPYWTNRTAVDRVLFEAGLRIWLHLHISCE